MTVTLPPWDQTWNALRLMLAPAFGASLVLMLVVRLLGRERLTPLAAALAVAGGVLAANHFRESLPYQFDNNRPLTVDDLGTVLGWSLEGKPKPPSQEDGTEQAPTSAPEPRMPDAWYWVLGLAGLAMLVELLARLPFVPSSAAWVARTLVAVLAGRLMTPGDLRAEHPWLPWLLTGAIFFEWALLVSLARRWKDGTVPAVVALWCAAAVLLMHVNFLHGMDGVLYFFAAMLGPALVAWKWPGDTGPAVVSAVVAVPGLLVFTYYDNSAADIQVPPVSFLLMGLAPLALMPMLMPFLIRQQRWKHWLPSIILLLIPVIAAVVLAADVGPLDFPSLEATALLCLGGQWANLLPPFRLKSAQPVAPYPGPLPPARIERTE
jgi:hypothetical protein